MPQLAEYASNSTLSRGRMFEVKDSPTRSQFQRDRDRIIHSSAFRRLQYKTQVFLHHEGSHFRTRLTHTLEVSQIARSIARALNVDEDLAEAISLAHDLGHTPFGHAGERVLHKKMQDFGGFDHNLQALRNITMLENHYAEHDGLNLTWETLEGILKHNGPFDNVDNNQMPIVFTTGNIFDLECRTYAGLEAQIAAIADDIAYNSHDIDDALRAGIISVKQLHQVDLLSEIIDEINKIYPDISNSRMGHEIQRRLITKLIEDVIYTTKTNIKKLAPKNVTDVRNSTKTIVSFSAKMVALENSLKTFLFKNVYRAPSVMKNVEISEMVVVKIFEQLLSNQNLPNEWSEKLHLTIDEAQKARIICDYIAGMTDPYALELYNRLFDEKLQFS